MSAVRWTCAAALALLAPAVAAQALSGMLPVVDARNLDSETAAGKWSPVVQGDLERIYVPNLRSNDVYVVGRRQVSLAGARYDDVIYRFDTASGEVKQIKVGAEPHGLTVWPQPGRYSRGHTGNLR